MMVIWRRLKARNAEQGKWCIARIPGSSGRPAGRGCFEGEREGGGRGRESEREAREKERERGSKSGHVIFVENMLWAATTVFGSRRGHVIFLQSIWAVSIVIIIIMIIIIMIMISKLLLWLLILFEGSILGARTHQRTHRGIGTHRHTTHYLQHHTLHRNRGLRRRKTAAREGRGGWVFYILMLLSIASVYHCTDYPLWYEYSTRFSQITGLSQRPRIIILL